MTVKHKKSNLFPLLLIILGILASAGLLWKCAGGSFGHLRVRVVDAYTLSPVRNASVIIAGPDMQLLTDKNGLAVFAGVPIRKNSVQESAFSQSWGECTIVVFSDGYRPTVMLCAHVYDKTVREGPTIYMFPEETDDAAIITIGESPDDEWLDALVEKYSR